jgi:hypothetical protein
MATCRRWIIGTALSLAAAILAAGPNSALASAAVHSNASANGWHIAYRVPSHAYEVGGLTAPGRNDAWAFVDHFQADRFLSAYYLHWAGHGWKRVTVPHSDGFVPDLIASAAPRVVWILGTDMTGDTEALAFSGEQWTLMTLPEGGNSLVVLGNDNVWIGGSGSCSPSGAACTTSVEHWDGASWHSWTLPVGAATVTGKGRQVWLAGSRVDKGGIYPRGREAVFRWMSGRWIQVAAPDREIVGYPSPGVSPTAEVWLLAKNAGAAKPHLDQRIGRRWSKFKVPDDLGPAANSAQLSFDGYHGFWVDSDHWTGQRWIRTLLPGQKSTVVAEYSTAPVPGMSSAWGIAQTSGAAPVSVLAIYGKLP